MKGKGHLPYLAGGGALSTSVERRLVETLFTQPTTMLAGGVAMTVLGLLEWRRLGGAWWLSWTVAAVALLAVRWRQQVALRQAGDRLDATDAARRFARLAWANGALWGAGSLVLMTMTSDPVAQFMLVSVQAGYIGGAVVRNNAAPAAALGQVYLTLVPLLAGCLATGDVYYVAYGVFVAQHILASTALVRFLSGRTVKLLIADESKDVLLEQIRIANERLESSNARLGELAATDALTGLPNRRTFDAALSEEWLRAIRLQKPLSVLMIDVDHFKWYNDSFGHRSGDECLCLIAATIRRAIRRPGDVAARYGGEEFVVVLPNTEPAGARTWAELLCADVLALGIPRSMDDSAPVSVSIGSATVHPSPGTEPSTLIELADEALYTAKNDGRNCVRSQYRDEVPVA
jgi:diguanylate cyclase (GGDEF)-like protein